MKLEELVETSENCCGCGACAEVCPAKAISIQPDPCGFMYPNINQQLCLDCKACISVCQYQQPLKLAKAKEAYAACGKDDKLVEKSASGGVFASLASSWLELGGLVAGAVLEIDNGSARVYHLLGDREADLQRMQGSKYVQSEAGACYADVLKALDEGRKVLFSGSPCQVAAVKKLTGDPENLLTVDIVCHGTPSNEMFGGYLKILEGYLGVTIKDFSFRDKTLKKTYCAKIVGEKAGKQKEFRISASKTSYYNYFLSAEILRDSCYACPYAKYGRVADLTIGDYWGFGEFHGKDVEEKKIPQRDHWSCLLVNTEKGQRALEKYGATLELISTKPEWAAKNNRQLNHPCEKPADREMLLGLYARSGYAAVEAAYIKSCGGAFTYYRRLIKDVLQNNRVAGKMKTKTHEN